ncbi:MAG: N-acetylmuramoyl-L-alanine amidase [Saprospirales bacterium]|nr:N-acetylmuramoyl-L-alanine amidase [Saprospirales bacterium]
MLKKLIYLSLVLACVSAGLAAQIPGRAVLKTTLIGAEHTTPVLTVLLLAPNHFVALTLRCSGVSMAGNVEVRSAADDSHWTGWQALSDDAHAVQKGGVRQFEMLFLPVTTRLIQVRVVGVKAPVTQTELFFYSPEKLLAADPQPIAAPRGGAACPCPMPAFVSRAGWGGPPAQQPGCTPNYTAVSHLIVHHQAGVANPPFAAVVGAIWQQHVYTNSWCDIGYNWLIAPDGTIYEGRAGGNNVVGAHFCGQNANTMGVCFLGNFQNEQPTAAALSSLSRLLAWKCCDSGINPTATAFHAGSGLTLQNISGHRNGCSTLCPGDNLYARLPGVRTMTDTLYSDPTGCDGLWPPGNDDCTDAFTLFSGNSCQAFAGTTDGATASGLPIPTCSGFTSGTALDVWYRFGALEDHHHVTVAPTGNLPGALDPVIAVYDGSCDALQLLACVDAPGGAGVATTLDLPGLVPGHVYYIRVYDYGDAPATDGRFDICVTHGPAVSTRENGPDAPVFLFPNPATGWVRVRLLPQVLDDAILRVFDAAGRLVLAQEIKKTVTELDLSGKAEGMYLFVVQSASGQFSRRLILRH